MKINLAMQIPALLSVVGSGAVIVTYLKFPQLRSIRYIEMVFYVAINDFLGSIEVSLGEQESGSIGCWIQGIGTGYNFLSSIFWSTVISYQIYLIVSRGKGLASLTTAHVVCWTLPMVLTLAPLITNTYGESDDDFWCFVSNRSNSPKRSVEFWDIFAFFFWLWICIIIILASFTLAGLTIREIERFSRLTVSNSVYLLVFYPIILVFCWLPPTIVIISDSLFNQHSPKSERVLRFMALAFPPLQGILLSIVFFGVNDIARKEWYAWWSGGDVEDRESAYVMYSESTDHQDPQQQRQSVQRGPTVQSKLHGTAPSSHGSHPSSKFTLSEGSAWSGNSESSLSKTTTRGSINVLHEEF